MVKHSVNKKYRRLLKGYANPIGLINSAPYRLFALLLFFQLFFSSVTHAFTQTMDSSALASDSSSLKFDLYNKNYAYNLQEYNATLINEAQAYLQQKGQSHITHSDFELITYLLYHALEDENIDLAKRYYGSLVQMADLSIEQSQVISYWKGRMHYEHKNYKAAITAFKQNELLYSSTAVNQSYQIKTWYCMALSYYNLHKYELAIVYFNKSLAMCKVKNDFYYKVLDKIAFSNFRLGNLTAAINCIDKHLPSTLANTNAALDLWQAKLLQLRAFFYREIATNTNDSLLILEKSLADCERSIPYLNRYLQQQYLESDQLKLNHKYNYFYYKTIEATSRLYNCTPNQDLLFKALHYAELDKNRVLSRCFNKQKAKQTLNIPSHYFTTLDSLYNALTTSKGDFYLNKHQPINNNYKKDYYSNKQQLIQAIHSTEQSFKQQYPEYASIHHALPPLDTRFIKELSHKQQIIEYVLSDEKIYIFLINNGTIHSYSCELDPDLLHLIHNFRMHTSSNNALNDNDSSFYNLATSAYALYQKIMEPLKEHMDTKPLLIIPDNELNLIPFEALLSEPYNKDAVEYSELAYLVKTYDISYANSLHLLQHQLTETNTAQNHNVLGYLPNYKELNKNTQKKYIAMRNAFGKMSDLIGARNEVKNISKKTNTVMRVNKQASEYDFINMTDKYAVIHCAMHTLIDHNNPQYSKMVFTPHADTLEDGFLHTYEINKLTLNCDLLVLSACNTGYGEINKGEGLLSLSRAFTKSGSKSILSTLWSIPDISSVHIIDEFYNGLIQNRTKSESLSHAKRHYLNEHAGITAHPFFWAGHIITGNNSALILNPVKTNRNYLLLAMSLGLFLLIYIWRKRKKTTHQTYAGSS